MNIRKPTKAELQPLYTEAMQGQTEAEWFKKILSSIAGILRKTPLRYRGYGPFWWLVKKSLIDHGYAEFGGHLDSEWIESLECGDPAYDLLCAWWYEEMRFAPGQMIMDPFHSLVDIDGEPFEYASSDEEMEMQGIAEGIK